MTDARDILGERVDLLAIDTSRPRPFLAGAHRILRPAVKMIWFSPRGTGKSLAAERRDYALTPAGRLALEAESRRLARAARTVMAQLRATVGAQA